MLNMICDEFVCREYGGMRCAYPPYGRISRYLQSCWMRYAYPPYDRISRYLQSRVDKQRASTVLQGAVNPISKIARNFEELGV